MKKFFTGLCIKGKNNSVIAFYGNKNHKLILKSENSKLKINGNNNIIKFCYNIKKFPSNLNLKISGNNNYVEIHKTQFVNCNIDIAHNDNKFILAEQNKQPLGSANIYLGNGGKIEIGKDCELGNHNLLIVVNGDYKNKHKLIIGDNVHIGYEAIIRTSDGQCLIDPETGIPTDEPQDVVISDNVWIMSRCIILKGTHLQEGSAVAANSLVNKKFTDKNILIAGSPAKIIKDNIIWAKCSYGKYMEYLNNKTV